MQTESKHKQTKTRNSLHNQPYERQSENPKNYVTETRKTKLKIMSPKHDNNKQTNILECVTYRTYTVVAWKTWPSKTRCLCSFE